MTIKAYAARQGWLVAAVAALLLAASNVAVRADVNIPTVTVGNPGNALDEHAMNNHPDGFGAVDYTYNISKYEVTAGQYTGFLNAVAATDTYGLYNSKMSSLSFAGCMIQQNTLPDGTHNYSVASDWTNRPVNYVSWGDAARFANWLQNGQPTGAQGLATTENGAYYLNGKTTNADLLTVSRQANWKWAIANEAEWYKAAYYDPNKLGGAGYWNYATRTDSIPSNVLGTPTDPGNNATFYLNGTFTLGSPYYFTEVGAHENSASAYGTYDQNGNVWEWTEDVMFDFLP